VKRSLSNPYPLFTVLCFDQSRTVTKYLVEPKLSDFLLDLRRSLAHKGFAKILYISTGMPAVFSNPYASRAQHISSQKIAQLGLEKNCEGLKNF
jgi:hypothetical protein